MDENDNIYTLEDKIATLQVEIAMLQADLDNCNKANELTVEEYHKKYDGRPPVVGFYRGWIPQRDCISLTKKLQDLQKQLKEALADQPLHPMVVTPSGEPAISGGYIPPESQAEQQAEYAQQAEHYKHLAREWNDIAAACGLGAAATWYLGATGWPEALGATAGVDVAIATWCSDQSEYYERLSHEK